MNIVLALGLRPGGADLPVAVKIPSPLEDHGVGIPEESADVERLDVDVTRLGSGVSGRVADVLVADVPRPLRVEREVCCRNAQVLAVEEDVVRLPLRRGYEDYGQVGGSPFRRARLLKDHLARVVARGVCAGPPLAVEVLVPFGDPVAGER